MTAVTEEIVYCPKHPTAEAPLHCIRCERPMCLQCIVPTSTGYMCKECSRRQEDRFFSTEARDYPLVFAICAAGCTVAGIFTMLLGFWWIGFLIGGAAGGATGSAARQVTGRRVGRYSVYAALGGAIAGAVLAPIVFVLLRFGTLVLNPGILFQVAGLEMIVCVVGFIVAVYSIYQRRI